MLMKDYEVIRYITFHYKTTDFEWQWFETPKATGFSLQTLLYLL